MSVAHFRAGQYIKVLAAPPANDVNPKKFKAEASTPLCNLTQAQKMLLKWVRVEVLETEYDAVNVRFPKKARKFDSWMPLERCREIRQFQVNWDSLDDKLPIDQEPRSRQVRKELFADWDTNRKKTLSLKELQAGVQRCVGRDLGSDVEEVEACVKSAWKASRNVSPKGSKKTVSPSEFHAFLVCLRWHLELAEIFERLDALQEDDQRLSVREMLRGIDLLHDFGIDETAIRARFADRDVAVWTPVLKFSDFATWCVEQRWGSPQFDLELDSDCEEVMMKAATTVICEDSEIDRAGRRHGAGDAENRRKIKATFEMYDHDRSGTITADELVEVFSSVDPPMSPEVIRRLFVLADVNNDGIVDYEEFCLWLFK